MTWVFTLEPLEEVSQTIVWDQKLRVFKDDKWDSLGVVKGTYRLKGIIPPYGYINTNGGPLTRIETASIAFTIA